MTLLESLYAQGVRAYREPRAAAADVLALGIPRDALVPGLFAVVALTVILNSVSEAIAPSPLGFLSPFRMATLVLLLMTVFSFAIAKTGQILGGLGSFPDALLLMIFLQAMFLPAVVVQLGLFLISPALAGFFILAMMLFLTWVHLNFIAALHGFPNLGKAVGVLLMAALFSFFALLFVAPLIISPSGVPADV